MTKIEFSLGDKSRDGHGISCAYILDVSCSLDALQEAFKRSHETLGFGMGYVLSGRSYPHKLSLCTEYEDNVISPEIVQILMDLKCPLVDEYGFTLGGDAEDGNYIEPEVYIDILMWYIGQSLKFTWNFSSERIPEFAGNGISSLGYGLFSN